MPCATCFSHERPRSEITSLHLPQPQFPPQANVRFHIEEAIIQEALLIFISSFAACTTDDYDIFALRYEE